MKTFTTIGIVIALLAGASLSRAEEIPEFPPPQQEHQWLQQLAGEWESEVEMFMEPGQPPVKSQGTESVRTVGGFWIVAENKGDFMGHPFTGLLTLGYDTQTEQYVGTWIDSMSGYLWKYEGTLAADMFWGDRYGVVVDPFGHNWSLATHINDPTPEEMAKAMEEAFAEQS